MKKKFFIITTVPQSLIFFSGQVKSLKKKFDVEVVSSSGELLTEFSTTEDVNYHIVDMERDISILKDLKSLYKMVQLFLKIKPNFVHGNTPKAGLISMISGWICRVPHRIYYIHGLRYQGSTGTKKFLLMTMERVACLLATDIFVVGQGVMDALYKDKITKKLVKLIGFGSINGTDVDYFHKTNSSIPAVDTNTKIAEGDFVYGFVGRLVADKGINELVSAFLKVNARFGATKLILVGSYETDLSPLGEQTLSTIDQNPNIVRYEFQSDVRPFYKLMDIFVFPSYREGLGMALIEAISMEVPVICSDIPGCNEIIIDNETGILVPKYSVDRLAEAMISLKNDKNKRSNLINKGRSEIIRKYNRKFVCENSLSIYRSLDRH